MDCHTWQHVNTAMKFVKTQRVIVDDNVDATDATEDLTNLSLFTDDAFNYMDEELVDFNYEATDVSEQ